MNTMPTMNQTGIIVNGRKAKRSAAENAILGSKIKIQHDEPESEEKTLIARSTKTFHKRSKSISMINGSRSTNQLIPTSTLNTHKRVFGDLNVSMAAAYGEDGLRDCAGKKSGLQARIGETPNGKGMSFDRSMSTSYKPSRRMHNKSIDNNTSNFDLKHNMNMSLEQTKVIKRPRSPWMRDPFQSQIRRFE